MEYKTVGNIKIPQNLSPEKQAMVDEIARNYAAKNREIDKDNLKNMGRIALGSILSGASFHPILNIPYVGTGLGGAMYDAGQAIVEGDNLGDIAKRAGRGFAIGETVGAVPYVGKGANKLSGGKIGNAVDAVAEKIAANPTVQKAYDALMTDVKAFNPNKQIAYHGSPYDFEKFSNEAIGTGEGAQAHGYGHYSALDKNIADKRYRENLVGDSYKIEGEIYNPDMSTYDFNPKAVLGDSEYYGGVENLINKNTKDLKYSEDLINKYDKLYTPEQIEADDILNMQYFNAQQDLERIPQEIEFLESIKGKKISKNQGQLYKLSIPKDDVMLREGATFAEQPKKVQNAIKEIIKENPELSEFIDTRTKDELFDLTEKATGKNGKKLMQNIFDAELSGDEKKIMSAWDKWNDFENQKVTDFDPNIVYGYLNNYKGKMLDDVDRIFTNKTSNTNLYKYLEDERNLNKALIDKGIKGISYNGGIDGEARVIFNPDDIDIVRKYYNQPNLKDIYNKFINSGTFVGALTNP